MWKEIDVPCQNCRKSFIQRFILIDEANNEHWVMDKCSVCKWQEVYLPELAHLAEEA